MRKIKEVLRLRNELKLSYQQIERSCAVGVGTVHNYIKRFKASGLSWTLAADWSEARLNAALYPPPKAKQQSAPQALPDFAVIHKELQSNKHVTLQLLWDEYRQSHPEGYGYSRYCELYQRWRKKLDAVLRQEHKAGEKMFVDWAGATLPVYDPKNGSWKP